MPVDLNIYVKEIGLLCAYDSIFNMRKYFLLAFSKEKIHISGFLKWEVLLNITCR